MKELLAFLKEHLSFLFEKQGVRVVDSQVRGRDALLVVEVGPLRLRLVRDRGQVFLDFQKSGSCGNDWFSFDLVQQLLTGKIADDVEMDAAKARFLQQHMAEIADLFRDDRWESTQEALRRLERQRARRLFANPGTEEQTSGDPPE